jgi:excinuclease UvrABC nuclease subunit
MDINITVDKTINFTEFSWEDRKNVPSGSAIYMFLDKNNKVLYVGESRRARTRILNHCNRAPFRSEIAKVWVAESSLDRYARQVIEGTLVTDFNAKYNCQDKDIEALKLGKAHSYKLTKWDFFEIRNIIEKRKATHIELAKRYNVHPNTINNVANLKTRGFRRWEEERLKVMATV